MNLKALFSPKPHPAPARTPERVARQPLQECLSGVVRPVFERSAAEVLAERQAQSGRSTGGTQFVP